MKWAEFLSPRSFSRACWASLLILQRRENICVDIYSVCSTWKGKKQAETEQVGGGFSICYTVEFQQRRPIKLSNTQQIGAVLCILYSQQHTNWYCNFFKRSSLKGWLWFPQSYGEFWVRSNDWPPGQMNFSRNWVLPSERDFCLWPKVTPKGRWAITLPARKLTDRTQL